MKTASLIARAVSLHQRGALAEAESVYRRVLKQQREHPDALHFLGLIAHQKGRAEEAIALLRRAVAAAPGYAAAACNLGNLLKLAGLPEEAEASYRRALAAQPDNADAWNNLAVLLKSRGELSEAEQACRRAIECRADHAPAYQNLGNILKNQGRHEEALAHYRMAMTLDPSDPEGCRLLGITLQRTGRIDEARGVFRDWLARDPRNPIARHLLAACEGTDLPSRAPDDYVRAEFDRLAESFDAHLAKLEYRAPSLLRERVLELLGEPKGELDVLDAGCGTGLCAAWLRGYARRLAGVDLSPKMLGLASRLRLYDDLVKGELTAEMTARRDALDLVVSADTLCYFGELEEVALAASGTLRSGGAIVFTVERGSDEDAPLGYRLQLNGRYQHTERHVRERLGRAGLVQIATRVDTLRNEGGKPVAGLVVSARKRVPERGEDSERNV